jgi:hypothetical protein
MPPAGPAAQDLHLRGRAKGGQHRLGIGLGVEDVDRAAAAMRVALGGCPDQQARGLQVLLPGSPPWKAGRSRRAPGP